MVAEDVNGERGRRRREQLASGNEILSWWAKIKVEQSPEAAAADMRVCASELERNWRVVCVATLWEEAERVRQS